jgi:hypothetical protein
LRFNKALATFSPPGPHARGTSEFSDSEFGRRAAFALHSRPSAMPADFDFAAKRFKWLN